MYDASNGLVATGSQDPLEAEDEALDQRLELAAVRGGVGGTEALDLEAADGCQNDARVGRRVVGPEHTSVLGQHGFEGLLPARVVVRSFGSFWTSSTRASSAISS